MRKFLVVLLATAAMATGGTALAGNDPGGAGGTHWQNSGVYCQSGTGRTFWHNTYYGYWVCAYSWEL